MSIDYTDNDKKMYRLTIDILLEYYTNNIFIVEELKALCRKEYNLLRDY